MFYFSCAERSINGFRKTSIGARLYGCVLQSVRTNARRASCRRLSFQPAPNAMTTSLWRRSTQPASVRSVPQFIFTDLEFGVSIDSWAGKDG